MKKIIMHGVFAWLLCLVIGVVFSGACLARTIHVPGDYTTIQAGIDAAVSSDVVLVAPGTYTDAGNKDLDFYGKAITVQSSGGADVTIIDCQGAGRGVLFHSGEGLDSRFIGFTIKNGYVNGSSLYGGKGGGIHCSNSSPAISNCVISQCVADGFGGGGILLYGSSAKIESTVIEHNSTDTAGGGLLITDSSPTILNSIIRYNSTFGYSSGGGVCVINSNPTISYCTISYNDSNTKYVPTGSEATNSGGISFRDGSTGILDSSIISYNKAQERGGIGSWDADPKITNCLIEGNEATMFGGGGIGLHSNSEAVILKSTIKNNRAKEYGGGVSVWNLTPSNSGPSITDSIIENNTAGDSSGGGNFLNSSAVISRSIIRGNTSRIRGGLGFKATSGTTVSVLVNDLIYDNTATGFGGGITCYGGGNADITNSTIVGNTSGTGAAGVYIDNATAQVANSILWTNSGSSLTPGASVSYSNIEGGYSGTGNIDSDPDFVSSTDFHLSASSLSINSGDNGALHRPLLDLGKNSRSDGAIDMGVYEYPYVAGGPGVSGKIGAYLTPVSPPIPGEANNIPAVLFLLLAAP